MGIASHPDLVLPGIPDHITRRGNGRQATFFEEADYAPYLDLFAPAVERAQCSVWTYCLMHNHAHVIIAPPDEDALRRFRPKLNSDSQVADRISTCASEPLRGPPAGRVGNL